MALRTDMPETHSNGHGFYRFDIGAFRAFVISDGFEDIPVGPIFAPNADVSSLDDTLQRNFMGQTVQATSNALLLEASGKLILLEAGWGEHFGPMFGKFPRLIAHLRNAGFDPADIDLVVMSHGHFDHIEGVVSANGERAFPNAEYAMVDKEWDYWTGARFEAELTASAMPDPFKEAMIASPKRVLPVIAERTRMVRADGEIAPGIHFVSSPGHSPGHASILIESNGERLFYMADIAHNPVTSLQHPDWSPVFDQDPAAAASSRTMILDRLATDRSLAMGYHFPFPALGHVIRDRSAFRWEPISWRW